MQPAHAVDDRRVIGVEGIGLDQKLTGFLKAIGFVGEDVTQRVEGRGIIGVLLEDGSQILLCSRKPVALVVKQRAGEDEVALLLCRSVLDGAVKQGFSLIQILVFDERLRVDQMKSAGLIGKAMQGALHVFSGAHEVAGADQDVQQVDGGGQEIIALVYLQVMDQRNLKIAAIFRQTAEVVMGCREGLIAVQQFFTSGYRCFRVFALECNDPEGQQQVAIVRNLYGQDFKLLLGQPQVVMSQDTGILQAQADVVRVLFQQGCHAGDGFFVALELMEQVG